MYASFFSYFNISFYVVFAVFYVVHLFNVSLQFVINEHGMVTIFWTLFLHNVIKVRLSVVSAAAAKASPPGIPNLDKVGKNYVDLSWTKPRTDGGSPIKGLCAAACVSEQYSVAGLV